MIAPRFPLTRPNIPPGGSPTRHAMSPGVRRSRTQFSKNARANVASVLGSHPCCVAISRAADNEIKTSARKIQECPSTGNRHPASLLAFCEIGGPDAKSAAFRIARALGALNAGGWGAVQVVVCRTERGVRRRARDRLAVGNICNILLPSSCSGTPCRRKTRRSEGRAGHEFQEQPAPDGHRSGAICMRGSDNVFDLIGCGNGHHRQFHPRRDRRLFLQTI